MTDSLHLPGILMDYLHIIYGMDGWDGRKGLEEASGAFLWHIDACGVENRIHLLEFNSISALAPNEFYSVSCFS